MAERQKRKALSFCRKTKDFLWCTRLDSNQRPLESEQAVPPFLWGVLVSYKCLKTLINQWFPAVLPVFLYLPVIPRIC